MPAIQSGILNGSKASATSETGWDERVIAATGNYYRFMRDVTRKIVPTTSAWVLLESFWNAA